MVASPETAIARARVAQIERVNGGAYPERVAYLERQIAELRGQLSAANATIETLRARGVGAPTFIFKGRPALLSHQIAARVGVSLSTVSRYVSTGWWEGEKRSGRLIVYADQPFSRKRGG